VNEIEIALHANITAETWQHVIDGLVAFNEAKAGPAQHTNLTALARRGGEIVGGVFGYTSWEWVFIAQLWVSDQVRGQGIGRRLLELVETAAREHGCRHAHVDTFSFQALPFYQHLGYRVFGQIDDFPAGHTRYFLAKRDLDRAMAAR
jgi:GNAT superfamily N-acetyltransferase